MKTSLSSHAPLWAASLLALVTAATAHAQPSVCASNGQPVPAALLERYISADCASCWQDQATPVAGPRQLAIDWIVPGSQGDDAPLAAAATRDALARLAANAQPTPTTRTDIVSAVLPHGPRPTLRVAHGLPLNGYVGASIRLQWGNSAQPPAGPLTAWLLLAETIPAGTERSPVPRQLARNLFMAEWRSPAAQGPARWQESRVMGIPEGTDPTRLTVVGWVQDVAGRVLAAAQSRCRP